MLHEQIEWEDPASKGGETKQKSTMKGGWSKNKSSDGKSQLEWLEISDKFEWTWVG